MAFNPLRALVGLASALNEGATELKYGRNYKQDAIDQDQADTDKRNALLATTAHTQAQTAAISAPDAYSLLTKGKAPMRPALPTDANVIPGPGGTSWALLSPEEQAAQAGRVATVKNSIDPKSGTDVRALAIQSKADALAGQAEARGDRRAATAIRVAAVKEVAQMKIDAQKAMPFTMQTMDASGNPSSVVTTKGAASDFSQGTAPALVGKEVPKAMTGTPQTRLKAAQLAISATPRIEQLLQDPEVQSGLGGLAGRITNVEQLLGAPSDMLSPKLLRLQGELSGFFDNNASVHGFRSAGAAEAKMRLLGSNIRDAAQIAAGLEGINNIAQLQVDENTQRAKGIPTLGNGRGSGATPAPIGGAPFDPAAFARAQGWVK